jgi:hypothetical protein
VCKRAGARVTQSEKRGKRANSPLRCDPASPRDCPDRSGHNLTSCGYSLQRRHLGGSCCIEGSPNSHLRRRLGDSCCAQSSLQRRHLEGIRDLDRTHHSPSNGSAASLPYSYSARLADDCSTEKDNRTLRNRFCGAMTCRTEAACTRTSSATHWRRRSESCMCRGRRSTCWWSWGC